MSDRQSMALRCSCLALVCTIWMLLLGGCEQVATSSQTQAQAAPANVGSEPPKSQPPAPLLLLDEPAGGPSNEPTADNSRCFVCHVNYMTEEVATTHARANTSCVACHGASDAHIADESWASGGNGTAPDRMYTRDKINPSCMVCHPKDKIDTPQHRVILADLAGPKVCTDCHGNHRLPTRRCKWK